MPFKRDSGKIVFTDDCIILPPDDAEGDATQMHVYGAPAGKELTMKQLFTDIFGGKYSHLTIIRVGIQLFDCTDPSKLDEILSKYEDDEDEYNANAFDIAQVYH